MHSFPRTEKAAEGIWHKPNARPLPALNLRPAFHSVAEGEKHPAVRIDCCVIHKPVEELLVEIYRQLLRLAKPRKETL